MQSHYKGLMNRLYVLNISMFGNILWNIVRFFLDPSTANKIVITPDNNEEQLKKIIMPSQLFKQYGGECDPPNSYWPPTFPDKPNRENFTEQHCTIEEFKAELQKNKVLVPTPNLAEYRRSFNKYQSKGVIEHKEFLLQNNKIQRRDSFNGIINDKTTDKIVEKSTEKIVENDSVKIKEKSVEIVPEKMPEKINEKAQEIAPIPSIPLKDNEIEEKSFNKTSSKKSKEIEKAPACCCNII